MERPCTMVFGCLLIAVSISAHAVAQTQWEKAIKRKDTLRFESYATSQQVEQIATNEDFRARVGETLRRMGITKLYVEVYRGGHTVSPEQLVFVRDWLIREGIDVVGGIATVPGGDVGVRQEGPLDWFNWQNAKTQRDIKRIVRMAAGVFDTFIVDDFLCTGDVSEESDKARAGRPWGEYRRDLMTQVAREAIVGPAKEVNPDITMIVKYPQWYDRFHLFGYDTETLPRIFDRVWVGTETRGRNTRRFGFVQPYEGFVNYRWLAGIAGEKIGGAWFDHGDCAENDFFDQAYMSVLAGARELVFFNLGDLLQGHPDHAKIVEQFDRLADLAAFVRTHPVVGVPAYKPPNSDPGGDMYIMDFLGMLGIPLVPVHEFPESAPVMFLPAQAAADPDLLPHVRAALDGGADVIVTASLLIALPQGGELARMVGVDPNLVSRPALGKFVSDDDSTTRREMKVDVESPIESKGEPGDLVCKVDGKRVLFLRTRSAGNGRVSLLNTHTFSQTDFDAVGEVLLCPRPLGLLSMEGTPLVRLRSLFSDGTPQRSTSSPSARGAKAALLGPSCVTLHQLSTTNGPNFVVQNFNDAEVAVSVAIPHDKETPARFIDRFSECEIPLLHDSRTSSLMLNLSIPARGRIWVQPETAR
ncbi:MAG: hypothetical protein ACM3VT_05770 [Solirubrobacterales bacterium]